MFRSFAAVIKLLYRISTIFFTTMSVHLFKVKRMNENDQIYILLKIDDSTLQRQLGM